MMRKVRWEIIIAVVLAVAIAGCLVIPAERLARGPSAVTNLFSIVEADLRNPILSSPAGISVLNGATKEIAQFAGYDDFHTRAEFDSEMKVVNVTQFAGDLFGILNARWVLKESAAAAGPALYISEGFWKEAFESDVEILGREMRIHQITYRIAGVLSAANWILGQTDLWIPMRSRGPLSEMGSMKIVGKLQWGVDLGGAQKLIAKAFRTFLPEQHYVDHPGARLLPISDALMIRGNTPAFAESASEVRMWSDS